MAEDERCKRNTAGNDLVKKKNTFLLLVLDSGDGTICAVVKHFRLWTSEFIHFHSVNQLMFSLLYLFTAHGVVLP